MIVPVRLRKIASYIEPGEKVADVGADHGLLELYLITRNTNNSVVAIENKKGPYNILKDNLIGVKNIRLSYSDGLEAVDKDVNTVVIAGMGGLNLVKILKVYPKKVQKLEKIIVDPHRDNYEVRKYITSLGFNIKNEDIVFEKEKFYVITVFKKVSRKTKYTEDQLEFGYNIFKHPLWNEYKNYLLDKANRNLENLSKDSLSDKYEKTETYIKRLENYGKN